MPELPEVETVRSGLESMVVGATITDLKIFTPSVIVAHPYQIDALRGQKIIACRRRGKYLIIDLSRDALLIHLRMTGQVLVKPVPVLADVQSLRPLPFTYYQRPLSHLPDKHTHGVFELADGRQLFYRDIRKFGRVHLLEKQELEHWPGLLKLGPEPLGKDFKLTDFRKRLQQSKRPIKALLLDQTQLAGLGNIYVDEALFVAGVLPGRAANSLKSTEVKALHQAIPQVLQKGIDAGGTSLKDYLQADGQQGSHQEHLFVYGRRNQPCWTCGAEIQKIVLAQRGTHFCAHCQK